MKRKFNIVFLTALAGALTGIVVSLFKLGIGKIGIFFRGFLQIAEADFTYKVLFLISFILMGVFADFCLKREPNISGSGIPQVSGQLKGKLNFNWFKVLFYKFIGGMVCIGSGLTLGREGPSIQIGASIGQGVAELSNQQDSKEYFIAGCAGAGMAAAFNSPLAGVIFCVEELIHKSTKRSFIQFALAVICATILSVLIAGGEEVFPVGAFESGQLPNLVYLGGLGVVTGLSGVLFNKCIIGGKKLYKSVKVPDVIKRVFPFVITAIILFFDESLFGSGESLILLPMNTNPQTPKLLYLFGMKLLLIVLAFCSGLPGGIFFPLLAMGSLMGNVYATLLFNMELIQYEAVLYIVIIAMAGHFASIVRAPVTGIVLILEMTGTSMSFLLPVLIVSYVSDVVAEVVGCEPIYESLLNLMLNDKTSKNC